MQGILRAGLNWSTGRMRPAGRSLATPGVGSYKTFRLLILPSFSSNRITRHLWGTMSRIS